MKAWSIIKKTWLIDGIVCSGGFLNQSSLALEFISNRSSYRSLMKPKISFKNKSFDDFEKLNKKISQI
jgi:hypothetical protein